MKYFLLIALATMSFSSMAQNCRLTGIIYDGFDCTGLTIRVNSTDEVHCKELALSTVNNNFFNHIRKDDRVISTRFKFKEGRRKVKEKILFEESFDACLPIGPIYGM